MKKINNKGMTLMELLVSVALISIIMLFMYKLISDVRSEKKDNDKVTDNILKISEIEVESINEIISELIYEKGELNTVRLWNDVWYNKDNNYVTGHFVRIDIIKTDGVENNYSIAIKDNANHNNPLEIHIRKLIYDETSGSDVWTTLKKWTLSEEIKDIYIKEACDFNNKQLVCQINFDLLDGNDENIYTISYPLYFYTNIFNTDNGLSRNCASGLGYYNCFNCPGNNNETLTYNYNKKYRTPIDISSKPNQCHK